MTLPYEQKVAVNNARLFLSSLLLPRRTPGVSKKMRIEAKYLLKHFPSPWEVDMIFKHYFDSDDIHCPKYFLDRYRKLEGEYSTLYEEMWKGA